MGNHLGFSLSLRNQQVGAAGDPVGAAIKAKLTAWWSLEEASGTRADSHTSGYDLTDNNTVGQAAGKVANAADFVAANSEYLSNTAIPAVNSAGWEIAGWVFFDSTAVSGFGLGSTFSGEYLWVGAFTNALKVASAGKTPGNGSALSTGAWYFVGMRWDGTQLHAYLDDNLDYSVTPSSGISWASEDAAVLGAQLGAAPTNYLDGRIDEVAYFLSDELTDEQRTWLYNAGAGRAYSDLG